MKILAVKNVNIDDYSQWKAESNKITNYIYTLAMKCKTDNVDLVLIRENDELERMFGIACYLANVAIDVYCDWEADIYNEVFKYSKQTWIKIEEEERLNKASIVLFFSNEKEDIPEDLITNLSNKTLIYVDTNSKKLIQVKK